MNRVTKIEWLGDDIIPFYIFLLRFWRLSHSISPCILEQGPSCRTQADISRTLDLPWKEGRYTFRCLGRRGDRESCTRRILKKYQNSLYERLGIYMSSKPLRIIRKARKSLKDEKLLPWLKWNGKTRNSSTHMQKPSCPQDHNKRMRRFKCNHNNA